MFVKTGLLRGGGGRRETIDLCFMKVIAWRKLASVVLRQSTDGMQTIVLPYERGMGCLPQRSRVHVLLLSNRGEGDPCVVNDPLIDEIDLVAVVKLLRLTIDSKRHRLWCYVNERTTRKMDKQMWHVKLKQRSKQRYEKEPRQDANGL